MDPDSGSRLLDPDPPKQSVLSGRVGNMLPAVQKNVPNPTSCRDGVHVLSATLPSCWGFHNRLHIFPCFFSRLYDFVTDLRVVGLVTGSAPVEHLHNVLCMT